MREVSEGYKKVRAAQLHRAYVMGKACANQPDASEAQPGANVP